MTPCGPFVQQLGPTLVQGHEPIFLNGINLAWVRWGKDFVEKDAISFCAIEEAMRFVVLHGGNALRIWIFSDPGSSLLWNDDWRVTGLHDGVIPIGRGLLELATHYQVRLVFTLFNGALARGRRDCGLFSIGDIVDTLVRNAIRPLAIAFRGYESLAMWEVANEIEGLLSPSTAMGPAITCPGPHNTAGWSGSCRIPIVTLQRFINQVAAAIKEVDPNHLLTLGAWSFCSTADLAGLHASNMWTAERLRKAGGKVRGFIDVWQIHSYPKESNGREFHAGSPALQSRQRYNLSGPVLIGEISNVCELDLNPRAPCNEYVGALTRLANSGCPRAAQESTLIDSRSSSGGLRSQAA